jgi:AcrB/AcrD/AcrF family
VPLVLAKGAGAKMRVALGFAVFSGMLGVTFFGLFFTPVFYAVIRWLGGSKAVATGPDLHQAAAVREATVDGPLAGKSVP